MNTGPEQNELRVNWNKKMLNFLPEVDKITKPYNQRSLNKSGTWNLISCNNSVSLNMPVTLSVELIKCSHNNDLFVS